MEAGVLEEGPTPGGMGVRRYEVPVAVIGDIHGRLDLLDRVLARLPADIPILVTGDVGDRGPDTRGVIERLCARGAAGVHGNHDIWLRDWAGGAPLDPFVLMPGMGGGPTLRSYGVTGRSLPEINAHYQRVPRHHHAWLAGLPAVLDLTVCGESYWLIHAGVPSTVGLSGVPLPAVVPYLVAHHPETLLWSKHDPEVMLPVDRPVVMGHVRRKKPLNLPHILAIDTGSGMEGGRLTAVILPSRELVTVGP